MNETIATTNNFLNIVLTLIGVFDVLRQRLHDNDRIVKAKNRKVFCLQKILKQKFKINKYEVFLSLSDEKNYSIAYVIIEKK